jgi:hypothetical protein
VFEHALSWALNKVTKKLNVYSTNEKIEHFFDLYKSGIVLDPESLIHTLETYKFYLEWCNNHFNVASYFYYDQHLQNIESYILNLPVFAGQTQLISWQEQYGMEFDTWNRCHYFQGDIGSIALDYSDSFLKIADSATKLTKPEIQFLEHYQAIADKSWPKVNSISDYQQLPHYIQQEAEQQFNLIVPTNDTLLSNTKVTMLEQSIETYLPAEHRDFLNHHTTQYQKTNTAIAKLVEQKIMISPPPIQKQTLAEKKYIIKNFEQCLEVYNQWIDRNPAIGNPIDSKVLDSFAGAERQRWKPNIISANLAGLLSDQPPTEQ